METQLIRKLESESKWREAETAWRKLGNHQDADACKMIAGAIKKGDAFRADVAEKIGEEPVLASTNVRVWMQWHKDLNSIYNKHFRYANTKTD